MSWFLYSVAFKIRPKGYIYSIYYILNWSLVRSRAEVISNLRNSHCSSEFNCSIQTSIKEDLLKVESLGLDIEPTTIFWILYIKIPFRKRISKLVVKTSDMKYCIAIVVLLGLVLAVTAGHKDPYIRNCPIGERDLSNSEEWSDNQRCVKYKCQVRGPDAALLITRCPSLGIYPPDKCTEEPGKGEFPSCCPTLNCK